MSTISATIQQEQQLELLKQQLMEHQRRKLRQLQKLQQQSVKQTQYQKLRKVCRDKTAATKENYLLHKFLFGSDAIPEDGVIGDGDGQEQQQPPSDNVNYLSDKEVKFLRMSEHQNGQHGKFVLSQQNQYLLKHHPPSAAGAHPQRRHLQQSQSQQNSPIRRPLASNANFWSNSNNTNNNSNVPVQPSAGSTHCYPSGEDLNEENLKTNVQIVLDNINRNYHALREQILSQHLVANNNSINQTTSQSGSNNNSSNQQANLVLLQRLQSVSQQLKRSGLKMASPDSDTNCNPYMPPLSCSIASSQDFSHDYSDYQWFMDYGSYRDGITHQSILSALSASYNGIGELSYYEDLAKNIDANLAEVDMESFRTEDIHSLLTTLPTLCNESAELRRNRNNNRGEIPGGGTDGGHGGGTDGTGVDMDNSICKSELLFSPVKESHISVDSLDMDGYPDEDDIILTCQANKNNYTIAFEQSVLYSDESFYDGPENYGKYKHMNLLNNLDHIIRKKAHETAMSLSEVGYTTWSKLRKNGPAQRLPLVVGNPLINQISRHAPTCFVRKSLSMPDLKDKCGSLLQIEAAEHNSRPKELHLHHHQLHVSQAADSTTSGESYSKQLRTLLPMYPVPTDFCSENPAPLRDSSLDNNDEQAQNQPSFNLVKLFIKQKSSSTDTCMDVSSGCWPSDSTNSASGGENNNTSNTNLTVASTKDRCRKKSMNDSGKCSTLGRHEEEEFQFDSLDAQINNNNNDNSNGVAPTATTETGEDKQERAKLNDFNSPAHKRNYKAYNLNIANKNMPAVNPVVYNLMNNNNNSNSNSTGSAGSGGNLSSSSINNNNNNNNNNSFKDNNSDASRTSENLTQIFNNSGNNNTGTKTKVPIEMITKSMQTSFIGTKDKVRVIPPSFLDRLNKLGDKQKAPVFVVYPNYVLPDLSFLNSQTDVVISPLSFKENFGQRTQIRKPRPVSMNDIENIKAKEYKHVLDWKSLITLLPHEYRKLLRNVPEANECNGAEDAAPQKPLFCMTPPLRRGRGVTCDCVNILNTQTYTSSSSGGSSSQPPSSGYRGSSTMLTDSEMDPLGPNGGSGAFNNNLYVYQYDSPAEVTSAERPPSGRVAPKGILRRTTVQRPPAKAKRNSMFEENHKVNQNIEKRRSLQEPCYNFSEENLILEDSINELSDAGPRKVNNSPNMSQHQPRLPNTPKLPSADDYHRLNKLNEMNDLELNKAVSNKLSRAQQHQSFEDDLEARMRAEHFLSNVPKSELKHYAEIAHVLETTTVEAATAPSEEMYDRTRLRHEVSRALAQRKNVSFTQAPSGVINTTPVRQQQPQLLRPTEIKFSTPPNSPNMSVTMPQKPPQKPAPSLQSPLSAEREKQDKIQSNRFKRLQIQWELLSKEGQQLQQELQQPRSGGNTPTGAMKSRIPRPVSYPTTRANSDPMVSKTLLKSPSRILPPKRYNAGSAASVAQSPKQVTSPPTPAPRTPSKPLHTTPKKGSAAAGSPRIPLGPVPKTTTVPMKTTTTPARVKPTTAISTVKASTKKSTTPVASAKLKGPSKAAC